MKRPWSTDDFFCFECMYFGGQNICHRFRQPLARKGWDKSCDKFTPHETFRARERQAEAEAAAQ